MIKGFNFVIYSAYCKFYEINEFYTIGVLVNLRYLDAF